MDKGTTTSSQSEHCNCAGRQQIRSGAEETGELRGGQSLCGRVQSLIHGDVGEDGSQCHGHIHVNCQEAAQGGGW